MVKYVTLQSVLESDFANKPNYTTLCRPRKHSYHNTPRGTDG